MSGPVEEIRRRSRWVLRVMEWDDARARYPNIWHAGMPVQVFVFDRVASRLRLDDLVAVYHPSSEKHAARADRFVGIARVAGLRRAHRPGFAWVDFETEHRFQPPLDLRDQPRRVFLCCDPGWPDEEVRLFRKVFDAAVAAGWKPAPEDLEPEGAPSAAPAGVPVDAEAEGAASALAAPRAESTVRRAAPAPAPVADPDARCFAGADYGADMRDPRDGTWLAVLAHAGDRLVVTRLDATGRSGLQRLLRDPDRTLMRADAIGLDFPFGLPLAFAERLFGGSFPEEGWWGLARRLERMTRPEYLTLIQDFRDAAGEPLRLTDERAGAFSPLHRAERDVGPATYHGVRMIAEDRSRYAIRPFESASGHLLLEVHPWSLERTLGLRGNGAKRARPLLEALAALPELPVDVPGPFRDVCLKCRAALDAVLAARCAARAVLGGEVDRAPDELAPGEGERVRREGWIYGVEAPG